jgi:hypothetical protein
MKTEWVYVAFCQDGMHVLNVWHQCGIGMKTLLNDRRKNGEALPGEHAVRISLATYNWIRSQYRLPLIKLVTG